MADTPIKLTPPHAVSLPVHRGTLKANTVIDHYSRVHGLSKIDPRMQGSGAAGEERQRTGRIPRSYWYVGGSQPENYIFDATNSLYKTILPAEVTKLYNLDEDSRGFLASTDDLDEVEKKIFRAGYHGYHNYNMRIPNALVLFHSVPVTQHPNSMSRPDLREQFTIPDREGTDRGPLTRPFLGEELPHCDECGFPHRRLRSTPMAFDGPKTKKSEPNYYEVLTKAAPDHDAVERWISAATEAEDPSQMWDEAAKDPKFLGAVFNHPNVSNVYSWDKKLLESTHAWDYVPHDLLRQVVPRRGLWGVLAAKHNFKGDQHKWYDVFPELVANRIANGDMNGHPKLREWLRKMPLPAFDKLVGMTERGTDTEDIGRAIFDEMKRRTTIDPHNTDPNIFPVSAMRQRLSDEANLRKEYYDPDSMLSTERDRVGVSFFGGKSFGLGKLRALRDQVLAAGGVIKREDLPPLPPAIGQAGLFNHRGDLSAEKIQSFIDKLPKLSYNYSHGEYNVPEQDHNGHNPNGVSFVSPNQRVWRLRLTNDHLRALQDEGLLDAFRELHKETYMHSDLLSAADLGWVRYDTNLDYDEDGVKKYPDAHMDRSGGKVHHIHIDNIQSDLGQYMLTNKKHGQVEPEALQRIGKILFGGKNPNEVIHEAFHQYLRDKGHAGAKVFMWDHKSKGQISLNDDAPEPGHMQVTYRDLPQKHGYEPTKYGWQEMPLQSNPQIQGYTGYKTVVRKAIEDLYAPMTETDDE